MGCCGGSSSSSSSSTSHASEPSCSEATYLDTIQVDSRCREMVESMCSDQ